ncbi:hypothetical protein VB715_10660 [Crocosphaera sp. UHCC 0190]|uniref:hypothetical protein n=1 Tax=Crocosphaera sp. UHCC 0190 TaxID=3110246 RepID=UPI002B1F4C9E|nr:hypothetical protein [Crocosphaera sp. UHCC 0190]MEA5510223.1 hypothetical protein [Crocosphaera sp. UHCC 0190]
MAIIPLKAWYLGEYEPLREVVKRPPDLRLSRNSLLKSALRADFLDEKQIIEESEWFQRYLEGEAVEFYIEGSGGYIIANLDLVSQEMYLSKQDITATLEPIIFFSGQTEYPDSSQIIQTVLGETIEKYNQRSRHLLSLTVASRPQDSPLRLSDSQLRKLRKSLLLVVDGTAITSIKQDDISRLIPSPSICTELGYALQHKRGGQILLLHQQRAELSGKWPFDLPPHQQLEFKTSAELSQTLPVVLEALLQRFKLAP